MARQILTHSGLSGLSIIALRKDYSPSETRFGVETAESDFCPMGYIQAPSIKKTPHMAGSWVDRVSLGLTGKPSASRVQ
jgi:hypothetical protein